MPLRRIKLFRQGYKGQRAMEGKWENEIWEKYRYLRYHCWMGFAIDY